MDLSKLNPKDAAIIKNNPDMTPYDLLHQKGLSESAYRKLVDEQNKEKDEARKRENEEEQPKQDKSSTGKEGEKHAMQPDSVKPIENKNEPHQPKLSPINERSGDTKKVYNKSTGQTNEMAAKLADQITRDYPDQYKIVE